MTVAGNGTRPLRTLPTGAWVAAALAVAVLLTVAGRYGFHGDEFYFVVTGHHLQPGAPDNPMGVPYLAAGWYALVGGHLWTFRVLPALAMGAYVLLGSATAAAYGGGRADRVVTAVAVAMTGLVLALGHLFETTTFDMLATAAALWQLVVALRADPPRWRPWLLVGVFTGVAMEFKVLAALVLGCCLLGVLILGPRRRLLDPRPWVAVVVALVLAAPNLAWQAAHGFPMLTVAGSIAGGGSTSSTPRAQLVPITLLELGPVVTIVLVVALVTLLRRGRRHTDGWLALGLLLFLVLMLATGGKAYYPGAFYPAVLAAGAGPILMWARHRPWRRILAVALVVVSLIVTPALTLPLGPPGSALYKVAIGPNPDLAAEIGWPGYVETVARTAAALPAAQRPRTVILTRSYEQAAALRVLGPRTAPDLPPVYSGHNAFWYWGPPPDSATDALVVGDLLVGPPDSVFASCRQVATVRTPPGIDNDLTDLPIRLCTGRRPPWTTAWPQLQLVG